MSLLNKFKKEFEGLNLSDRLQGQQPGGTHQSYNTGNQQQGSGYPPYNVYESYSIQERYDPQGTPSYNSLSQTLQQPQHQQRPSSSGPISSLPNAPYIQSSPAALTPYGALGGQNAPPSPTPPRWVAHWSEHDRQWYYVETSGRTLWHLPSGFPPLSTMPAYPGSLNIVNWGHEGQSQTHLVQRIYAKPADEARQNLPKESRQPSSQALLAAAGGFAAGGIAGYLIKDRIGKYIYLLPLQWSNVAPVDGRKAKKRHGRNAEDFADFSEYPNMEVNLDCNICDQAISGPYAHCKECDGGDYDICRDCLAQDQTCDGNGKHNLVKVYPKYFCDICDQLIRGQFYHCASCNNADWDTCQGCLDKGYTCLGPDRGETHDLIKLALILMMSASWASSTASFAPQIFNITSMFVQDHGTKQVPCTSVCEGSEKDIDLAVSAARKAFEGEWKKVTPQQRGVYLHKLADIAEKNLDLLASVESLNNGKSITNARGDGKTIDIAPDMFHYTRCELIGVCGQITPWNFPLLMLAWKIGPALATGNTIVMKTSEQTLLSALVFTQYIEQAGFPSGVFNLVSGYGKTAGAALSAPDEGATVVTGGERLGDKGYFIKPTIFSDVRPDMKIMQEEIFGPVCASSKFKDEVEAIALAHDINHGLAAIKLS
ncbi:hypothetical protein ACKAV7_008438 [Fusarium commune]